MASASESLVIPRSASDIFDFLADGEQNYRWREDVVEVIFAGGPPESAVWAQTVRRDGRERNSDYRVTFYERPTRIEFIVVNGSPRPIYNWELRPLDPGSTRVTLTVEVSPIWAPIPLFRLGGRQAQLEAERIHDLAEALADTAP